MRDSNFSLTSNTHIPWRNVAASEQCSRLLLQDIFFKFLYADLHRSIMNRRFLEYSPLSGSAVIYFHLQLSIHRLLYSG